ncbi:hypothetical protein AZE42_12081 [Rhizopogon vesiculosus]|uniref:Uncharacterized protein n=1 Tax=Rhizopogon vesiculosus TaxID=180088 RepID=A0A1J8PLY5_9AGAM|nr:hypothetical protein AZE42_12081 [Rhizopogon vesiculosus]
MVAIWKKIYDLLWPLPAKKRWGLTHAKLINVLQEMIDAVPVDEDGAPDRSLMMTAVMVDQMEYLPASLPPPSSHISASSGFTGFEIYTPEQMHKSLQTSANSSGSKKHKAHSLQDSDRSTSVTTSSSVFPLSGTAGTSINSSNLSGEGKCQRKSKG